MLERLDEDARMVFTRAREEARALGRDCIDTEHVLLGVCHQDEGDSDPVLAPVGITTQSVKTWLAHHGDQDRHAPASRLQRDQRPSVQGRAVTGKARVPAGPRPGRHRWAHPPRHRSQPPSLRALRRRRGAPAPERYRRTRKVIVLRHRATRVGHLLLRQGDGDLLSRHTNYHTFAASLRDTGVTFCLKRR